MEITDLNICFHTSRISECVEFYKKYLKAKVTFESEWFVGISFRVNRKMCFMCPNNGEEIRKLNK